MGSEASKSSGALNGSATRTGKNVRRASITHGPTCGPTPGTARHAGSIGNLSAGGLPPKSGIGSSTSCNENLLGVGLCGGAVDSRSRSGSASSSTPKSKKPLITLKNRQLIQSCFQNPHENLGKRILKRTAEKRKDFGRFYLSLNADQKDDIEETIKTLLKKAVANIEFMDEVQRLASECGGRFVQYRTIGFKADYFSTIGDATITECVFLDNAVHQAHQTLSAFSQFITMLLSSVRDGFYNEMKRLRRTSNSFSTGSNGSNNGGGVTRKAAAATAVVSSRDASPRSVSPGAESLRGSGGGDESGAATPARDDRRESASRSPSAEPPPSDDVQKLSREAAAESCVYVNSVPPDTLQAVLSTVAASRNTAKSNSPPTSQNGSTVPTMVVTKTPSMESSPDGDEYSAKHASAVLPSVENFLD